MVVLFLSLFFFFKQKTAYEMRISDWSSDVCSSDLDCRSQRVAARIEHAHRFMRRRNRSRMPHSGSAGSCRGRHSCGRLMRICAGPSGSWRIKSSRVTANAYSFRLYCRCLRGNRWMLLLLGMVAAWQNAALDGRSEEHTSELLSLMRISYAD